MADGWVFVLLVFGLSVVTCSPCDFYRPYFGQGQCTNTSKDALLEPNPGKTPFGGVDVTGASCPFVSAPTCCGIHPRWNWILAGCDHNIPPVPHSSSFACKSDVQNSSFYELYYIAAYQWNAGANTWVLDTTSSVFGDGNGGVINGGSAFEKLKTTGPGSYSGPSDWQLKWAPRTANTGTQGLGPPGFMFVISAKKLGWMSFYSLTQKTINRGTENQFSPAGYDNCWYAELDFLEAPFWGGANRACMLSNHPTASFFSTGAQYGGCFPMGANMGPEFQSECTTEWCCEGVRCSQNYKGFIVPSTYGSTYAGCEPSSDPNPPAGNVWAGPTSNPAECGNFNVLGGCRSDSFFDNDPNKEMIFAFVVDKRGVYSYRWFSDNPTVWPGIEKYSAKSVLTANRPSSRPTKTTPPCLSGDDYCLLFHPGAAGERACVSAGGDYKQLENMGLAAAEGRNWWNWFNDTGNWWNYDSSILNKVYP